MGHNDQTEKIVWVFVRKCLCGLYRNALKDVGEIIDEIKVPRDGFHIHTSENCDLYISPHFNGHRKVFIVQKRCFCRTESRSYGRECKYI